MQKPITCKGCPLEQRGLGFSRPVGTGRNGVLIVGESLGREEYLAGTPFVKHAQAGSALERAFGLAGVERQEFLLWNIVACQPPGNKLEGTDYGQQAIEHCKVHFQKVLQTHREMVTRTNDNSRGIPVWLSIRPVILALGNVALKTLTGVSGNPGEKQSITHLRGYPLPAKDYPGLWVVGSYHPSFIRRGNANLFPALMDDIAKAIEIANGSFDWFMGGGNYIEPSYILHPSIADASSFYEKVKSNPNLPLAMDIETQETDAEEDEREDSRGTIELIQFSLGKRTGIAIPFTLGFWDIIQKICGSPNPKLGFNWWGFDEPRVRQAGIRVNGQVHDLMIMFSKYSPGLRKHLQAVASYARFPFPWKHKYGSNLEFYGCADVDALHWIWEWLPQQMKELGVWRQYETICDYKVILDRAARVGIPIDNDARQRLSIRLDAERARTEQELINIIPIETRSVAPRRKNKETGETEEGYVKPPRELVDLWIAHKESGGTGADFFPVAQAHGYVKRGNAWAKLLPLKMSQQQVFRYIQWKKNQLLKEEKNVTV